MDEISTPPRSVFRYRALTALFIALAVVAAGYIFWRGLSAGSEQQPAPLLGQATQIEWQGKMRSFMLVEYADLGRLAIGELVVREKEVPAVVWRVASRNAGRVVLVSGRRRQEVRLPVPGRAPRYVLVVTGAER